MKSTDICIIGIPEGEEKEKGEKILCEEIMDDTIFNLRRKNNPVPEGQRAPNKINPRKPTPRHSIIKTAKVKERLLKATRGNNQSCTRETL